MQSSRMPMTGGLTLKKKKSPQEPIKFPQKTTNEQRKSAVAKARNQKVMRERKNG